MPLALALLALAAAVLLHALLMRLPRAPGSVATFIGVGAVGAIVLAAILIRMFGLAPEAFAAGLIYAFGCELYLFLSTFSLASISSNILAELRLGPLTEGELARRYASERMVRLRIERLLAAGLMVEADGAFQLTPKGAHLVGILERLRALFGH